jgi:hypothetical protein
MDDFKKKWFNEFYPSTEGSLAGLGEMIASVLAEIPEKDRASAVYVCDVVEGTGNFEIAVYTVSEKSAQDSLDEVERNLLAADIAINEAYETFRRLLKERDDLAIQAQK